MELSFKMKSKLWIHLHVSIQYTVGLADYCLTEQKCNFGKDIHGFNAERWSK